MPAECTCPSSCADGGLEEQTCLQVWVQEELRAGRGTAALPLNNTCFIVVLGGMAALLSKLLIISHSKTLAFLYHNM